jgi:hypothetical protein
MADATTTFSHYDRSDPSVSDDHPTLATQNRRVIIPKPNQAPPRPGQHLDGLYYNSLEFFFFLKNYVI